MVCSCPKFGGAGVVDSARRFDDAANFGPPPLVIVDGHAAAHECHTAKFVRRPDPGRSGLTWTPQVAMSSLTERSRQWLEAMPPARREAAIADAIDAASAAANGADVDAEARWCEACQVYRDADGCDCRWLASDSSG